MKALSVQQPWAWLIIHGGKDIENRTRNTKLRGRILIHASKKFDMQGYYQIKEKFPDLKMPFWNGHCSEFKTGGIIGSVEIVASVKFNSSRWFSGPVGYVLKNPLELPFTPMRGNLGFFTPKLDLPIAKE